MEEALPALIEYAKNDVVNTEENKNRFSSRRIIRYVITLLSVITVISSTIELYKIADFNVVLQDINKKCSCVNSTF